MSLLSFNRFKLHCPHKVEDAWKRLLDASENRVGQESGSWSPLHFAKNANIKYMGKLKDYKFTIGPLVTRGGAGVTKRVPLTLIGKIKPHWSGCVVQGWIWVGSFSAFFLGLILILFFFGLYNYFFGPHAVGELKLVSLAAILVVMLGVWRRAVVRETKALGRLLSAQEFMDPMV